MQRFNADNDREQGARSRMVKKSFICSSIIIQKGNKCYKKKWQACRVRVSRVCRGGKCRGDVECVEESKSEGEDEG